MKKKGILEGRKSKGGTRTLGRLCGLLIAALLAEGMPSGTIVSTYAAQHDGLESAVEMYEEKGEDLAAKRLIYTPAKEAADSEKGKKNDSEGNDQEDAVPAPTKKPKKTPAPTPKDTEGKGDEDLTGEGEDSSKDSEDNDQEDAVPAPTKKPKKTPTPTPKDKELDKEEDPSKENENEDSSPENNESDDKEDKTLFEGENDNEDEDENENENNSDNNEDNDDKDSDKEENDEDDKEKEDDKDEDEEDRNGEGDDLEDAVPTPTKKPKKTPTPAPDKELVEGEEGESGEGTAAPSENEEPENSQTPTPAPTKAPSKTWSVNVPTQSDDARYQYLLGIDSRVITIDNPPAGYRNATEAARNMKTITVPVWKMTASGGRMTSSMQLTIHKKLARNVQEIFKEIYALELKFPIKVLKGFMYRKVGGVALSKSRIMSIHSFGAAIDINPGDYDNDYYLGKGNDLRDKSNPYCIPDEVIAIFEKYGWFWGGNFEICADTMHFQYFELGMLTYQDNWPFRRLKVKSGYMAGSDVRNLQQRLRELGFSVSVDGVYGNKTADAIMRYQKSRGLEATGEMDYKTWETIINETHYMSYAF